MRTFYIASAIFILFVVWLLNKPIERKQQVARAFTESEIDYLEKSFNYAMETLKEGEYLDWSAAAVNGRISVGKVYNSAQKTTCRNYVEVARTHDAQKVDSGVACKRSGKEGWCRVHGKDPQSCALEVMESSVNKKARYAILQGMQVIDDIMGTSVSVDTSGLTPRVPSIPSIGPLPEVNAPDIEPSDLRPPMPWDPGQ